MKQYLDLVEHVLANGTRKENRTGVDTLSTFGYYYEHDLRDGFPLLTTKKVSWKSIVIELLWFLSGSDKSDFLERHGCTFWRPWYNEDGTVKNCYGPAWRLFPSHSEHGLAPESNDQIGWLVKELKRNPMSRRMIVSAWAPSIAQTAPLPPCHCMFICNVQNTEGGQRLCLHLTQRSADCLIGVPFNLASYALLTHLLSRFSGVEPGIFGHTLIDAHVYTAKPDGSMAEYDHIPGALEQLKREPRALPRLHISDEMQTLEDVERLLHSSVTTEEIMKHFVLEGYDPHPAIPFRVAV